ncbi:hypothetical protein, partial [Klebsiella variicola]|uniref:hypothetical protein n=1 Tax=Klebsiella variicola TaxID=244366 RepID=UPI001C7019EA
KGWDARKRAYCLKIQPATGSFARNLIYSTKPKAYTSNIPPWEVFVRILRERGHDSIADTIERFL